MGPPTTATGTGSLTTKKRMGAGQRPKLVTSAASSRLGSAGLARPSGSSRYLRSRWGGGGGGGSGRCRLEYLDHPSRHRRFMEAASKGSPGSGASSSSAKGPRAGRFRDLFLGDEAKSREETKLVRKLDIVILSYCCVSSFFNHLDRASFANAYVAGLKEDLGLHGSQYNVVLSMFTAGAVLGQIPHALMIQKVAPRIWLPSMVIVWAALTMSCAATHSYAQLCAVRFFQGFAEASTYCGTIYIIGCWYKPREIVKRTAIFTASGQAGTMFSGLMMTATYKGMNGYAGLAGWKWLFIINGIITLPIAAVGFCFFPDLPENTAASWLDKAERELALARLPPKDPEGHSIKPWSLAKRVFGRPALYILCIFSIVSGALEAYVVQSLFLLWMKAHKKIFSQTQINTYPLGVQATGIVSTFLAAVHIDATGQRVPMGLLAALLQFVATVILLVPGIPHGATFFAFYLAGTSYIVNPVSYGWASIILKRGGDDAARSVILYSMNAVQTCLYTWWGIVMYPADHAPYWRKGYIAMLVVVFVMCAALYGMWWLDRSTLAKMPDSETAVRDLVGAPPPPLSEAGACGGGGGGGRAVAESEFGCVTAQNVDKGRTGKSGEIVEIVPHDNGKKFA